MNEIMGSQEKLTKKRKMLHRKKIYHEKVS